MSTQSVAQKTSFSILFAISIAHLLNDATQSVVPAIYPILKSDYSLTFTQIGIITLAFQMTSSILQPFVGRFSDKNPSPFIMTWGMLFLLAGLVALSCSGSYVSIILSVSILGMGSSIFHPEASRVAQAAAGHRKGLAQSIFQVGGNTGAAIGPLLAALIVLPNGKEAVIWFSIAAVSGALVVMRIGVWYKNILSKIRSNVSTPTAKVIHSLTPRQIRNAMIVLVLLTFSKQFYLSSMTSYFTFFLIDKFGISIQESQLCLFAFLTASAIGIIIGGYIGDRIGRKNVIWCSILGAAPFSLLLPYTGYAMTIFLAVMVGLIISSAFSAILVFATELKPQHIGTIAGLFFGLSFGLGGVGAAFFGWLAELTSIEFVFQISSLLPLLGIVAAYLPKIKG